MDFSLTSEQLLLKDSVERYVADHVAHWGTGGAGWTDRALFHQHWSELAALGWLGASLPESAGGFGGDVTEALLIHEAFGAGLMALPLLDCATIPAHAVRELTGGAAPLLQDLVSGTHVVCLAHAEAAGWEPHRVACRGTAEAGGGWVLRGRKPAVGGLAVADTVVASIRTAGSDADPDGITLVAIGVGQLGGRVRCVPTVDGMPAAHLELDGLHVAQNQVLGAAGEAGAALQYAADLAALAICADAVGAMTSALWITRDHLRTRQQFGVPLARFQALQHRMADMVIHLEQSRSILLRGLAGMLGTDATQRARAVSACKVRVAEAATFVGGQAIHLHGAIGVTAEHPISQYYQRLAMVGVRFGSTAFHLDRYAASPA